MDPFGDLHAVADRGMFTGNRGCLINDDGIGPVRHHNGSLWIICLTRVGNWRHPLDAPRTWTPLFFLDDAAALAAGHRPCGLCRRAAYLAYRRGVTIDAGAESPVLATELNRRLAAERLRRGRGLDRAGDRIRHRAELATLPVGAVVCFPGTDGPMLFTGTHLQPFRFSGWGDPIDLPDGPVDVLTPPTSLAALHNGFEPVLHASAKI